MSGDHYIEQLETHCRRLQADNDELRAQVQAVRDWAQRSDVPAVMGDWTAGYSSARRDSLRALDGGDV